MKGSPADPNRLYASQSSGWFGQLIQRSTTAAEPGSRSATSSTTMASPGPISGTTAPPIRGNSSAYGISNRRCTDPDTVFAGRGGRRPVPLHRRRTKLAGAFRVCAVMAPARAGSRAPAACACTPSFSIPSDPATDFHRHFRRGSVSHRRWRRNLAADQPRPPFAVPPRSRRPRWDTACIASPCIRRGPACCSCRNTGT